jgi:hypothetical protein
MQDRLGGIDPTLIRNWVSRLENLDVIRQRAVSMALFGDDDPGGNGSAQDCHCPGRHGSGCLADRHNVDALGRGQRLPLDEQIVAVPEESVPHGTNRV